MTIPLKHSRQKGFKTRQRDRVTSQVASQRGSGRRQLDLFTAHQRKATPISDRAALRVKPAPSSWHQSKAERYWIFCNYLDKQFGGLFYRAEVDYITEHFKGRTGLIEPREFDIVAEAAVSWFINGRAAA